MKIQEIQLVELFGYYTYTIQIRNEITIVHGPNGCGKTTLLKIIHAIFHNDIDFLKRVEFSSILFKFDDSTQLYAFKKSFQISTSSIEKKPKSIAYISFKLVENGEEKEFDPMLNEDEYTQAIKDAVTKTRILPFLERKTSDTWIDRRSDIEISFDEVMERYGSRIFQRVGLLEFTVPDQVKAIVEQIDVRLITADRLTVQKKVERSYGEDGIKIEQKVAVLAADISKKIKETIQKYALLSQSKDRTFPLRVIKSTSPLSVEEIKDKMVQLEQKRKQFVETGLLEEENDIDIAELVESITESNRQTLSLYAIDTEEKLNALASLSESIRLFQSLIEKTFNNKRIVFEKEFGFKFVTTYSNTVITPESLSSGEQHELVMFYDLIFNTTDNTLVLIDEPELSLHIKWQLEYIHDLLEIAKVSGFNAIIATHSPQIINDNWNMTISLVSEG